MMLFKSVAFTFSDSVVTTHECVTETMPLPTVCFGSADSALQIAHIRLERLCFRLAQLITNVKKKLKNQKYQKGEQHKVEEGPRVKKICVSLGLGLGSK